VSNYNKKNKTRGCVSDSFELDLQRFAGDLATWSAQLCSPSASEAATLTTGDVGPPRAVCGSHSPRVARAWRATLLSSGRVLGVFQDERVFDDSRGGLGVARVLHAPASGRFSSSGSFRASVICIFHFVHPCLCSQFTFALGCKLLGHLRWLVS
jgi:hypothetical protein